MDPIPVLKRDLSMLLDQELGKRLLPGEQVLVSLPGSFGEAFVVTDKRAIVLRDRDAGPGCDVYAYPLSTVTGAEATSSGAGGYIEVKLTDSLSEPDQARVYFPAYDLEKFKKAAEFVVAGVHPEPVEGSDADKTDACPECLSPIEPDSVFCGQCGAQVRVICSQCGVSSKRGDKFCRYCGRAMQEMAPTCDKCGSRVLRGMTFCTECGSLMRQSCASCGSMVIDGWKYCPACGRRLGTGYVNPRTAVARRIQSRLEERQEAERPVDQTPPETLAPPPPQVETAPSSPNDVLRAAEQHNQRGRRLFDEEDVEGAIMEFQAAVRLDPGNGSYHCNLAVAYDDNDQDAEALAEYENTLRLDPNDLTALLSLGYMYNENEEYDKAREVWTRLIKTAPDSAEAQEARTNLDNLAQL